MKHLKPCLRVHTLISAQHESIKLGQVIHLDVFFGVVVSNYRLENLEMAYIIHTAHFHMILLKGAVQQLLRM